ncbi:uncharacterized protein LOC144349564 [Saccoglossus kowalevskii]
MDAASLQAFLTASNLILDHKLASKLKAMDILPILTQFNSLTPQEAQYVYNGATDKIKTERLLAKIKQRGAQGYWNLRRALELFGAKYSDLVEAIDLAMPPQTPGF